ncbi:pirin family protein [Variovorax sp. KK3]|uniref:pirin family protein n=1 Tax=Variovorax sp. KK3 TaxID=1855728 RepID=UPI00097CA177|nr:pirin family protein [Variovorax sp. KK3]
MSSAVRRPERTIPESRVRRAHQRGVQETDWLVARFSFSFGDYHDPNHTHWGSLRALNEDWVAPGRGFAWHGHRDIEAITLPIQGRIHHTDNLGNDYVFGPGEVMRMSAGSGIAHAEMNASDAEAERHLQIWLYPRRRGTAPECELVRIDAQNKRDRWCVIASPDGREGSLSVQQEALIFSTCLSLGASLPCPLAPHRLGYLHVVSGELDVDGALRLGPGDALRFTHETPPLVTAAAPDTEALLFDL